MKNIINILLERERKLLSKFRKNYNDLKHNVYYKVDRTIISKLISDFIEKIDLTENN